MKVMNIVDEIARRAVANHPAVISEGIVVTYGELLNHAHQVSSWLSNCEGFAGVLSPRVGLVCRNGIEYIGLALGILKAGGCLVPLAGELTAWERRDLASRTGLHGVLLGSDEIWLKDPISSKTKDASWIPLKTHLQASFPENAFQALNPAFIRFSSGTTGDSKGVVISHPSLEERLTAANQALEIGPRDRVLWLLPMAHHFAVSIVLYL